MRAYPVVVQGCGCADLQPRCADGDERWSPRRSTNSPVRSVVGLCPSAFRRRTSLTSYAIRAGFSCSFGPAGIAELDRLVERKTWKGLMERLEEMERRYWLRCPDCGDDFWIEPNLIKTSSFD